jgi:hypothetical protein
MSERDTRASVEAREAEIAAYWARHEGERPMLEIPLGVVTVRVWRPDYLETVWPDGKVCPALFVDDDQARQHAREWGYGDDVRRMHFEHELTHTLLAQVVGQAYSATLAHVAGVQHTPEGARALEEHLVVEHQKVTTALRAAWAQFNHACYRWALEHADDDLRGQLEGRG